MPMRLYELTAEYARLCDAAEEGDDVSDALATINDALEVKAERIAYVLRNLDANETALDTEIERLRARRDSMMRQRQRLHSHLRSCMETTGIEKIKCRAFTLALHQPQPHVVIENADAIPPEYVRTKKEPDKQAILRAFKQNGECVPGTRMENSRSLRIR
jgi:seryl-tRNA(Sec) selenium transferase